ncbi:MAG: DPP IV N-terminal domain-containing protein, partial [Planctomycetales bacterium]
GRGVARVSALALFLFAASASAEEIRLTEDGSLKRDPVFIAGGSQIVFSVDESDILIRLMRLDLESGEIEPLRPRNNTNEFETAFSSDDRYWAITHNKSNLGMEMVIVDSKTDKEFKVTHSGRGGTRAPVFSPDDKRVIYCFAETGSQQVWSVNLEAKDKKQLSDGQGINNWPSFTPDGKTIVFSSSRDGAYELYSMDADGKNPRRITNNNFSEFRPRLSPDGKRIAYVSFDGGDRDVFVMDLDGNNIRRVTDNPERDDYPSWSPDGKRLVIVSERRGEHDLYLVDAP